MARLTNKQISELSRAIGHLERAKRFIDQPGTVIAARRERATTTIDYIRPDGAVLCEVAKDIGSDLCGLDMGIRAIRAFIEVATTAQRG